MPTDLFESSKPVSISDSPVYFTPIHKDAQMPAYAKAGDAGMDLYVVEDRDIYPNTNSVIGTGLRVKIPAGCVGLVCPRSGLAAKAQITVGNSPGILDSGYTGELKIIIHNHGKNVYAVRSGDKIAQLVITPFVRPSLILVDAETFETFNTERGSDGFGSTGTK